MKCFQIFRIKLFLLVAQFVTQFGLFTITALDHENNYPDGWLVEDDNQSMTFSNEEVGQVDVFNLAVDTNNLPPSTFPIFPIEAENFTGISDNDSIIIQNVNNNNTNNNNNNYNNNYYYILSALSETIKKTTSPYSNREFTTLESSTKKILRPSKKLSYSSTNRKYIPLRSSTDSITNARTKQAFWDYGDKDNVKPVDYDYQAVLKDEPEENCNGFLRSRRNCRIGYVNFGLFGILFIGFAFILVLLLCACKGCRCIQTLLKRRLRYVPVATKD